MRYPILLLLLLTLCTSGRAQQCYTVTPDDFRPYTAEELAVAKNSTDTLMPTVYLEVDYDIVEHFGSPAEAELFVRGVFREVAAIYMRDVMVRPLLDLYVHTEPSGYAAQTSYEALQEFRAMRPSHPGHVAQLLSFRASGGIAFVDQTCNGNYNYSFSSIRPQYNPHEIYSWTVMVITHELGHLFGSQHTQACVWNGNNTALDGCVPPEGGCNRPPLPAAGSVMSYCHLRREVPNVLRILAQPAAVIRARLLAAGCVPSKPAGPKPPLACNEQELTVSLLTDLHPRETRWAITNEDGVTILTSPAYIKGQYNTRLDTTFCLPAGCYDFRITDWDGIDHPEYGRGAYALIYDGDTLVSGGDFRRYAAHEVCLGVSPPSCDYLDLTDQRPYGGNQDRGTAVTEGQRITLTGNAWKAIPFEYDVTENTVLEAYFKSPAIGQIHGIGLDDNIVLSADRTFRLGGTQAWGIPDYAGYRPGNNWMRVRIPVGRYYTGPARYLFFVSDNDVANPDNVSIFRDVRVHEGECGGGLPPLPAELRAPTVPARGPWLLSDLTGRVISRGKAGGPDEAALDCGVYVVSRQTDEGPQARKIVVR